LLEWIAISIKWSSGIGFNSNQSTILKSLIVSHLNSLSNELLIGELIIEIIIHLDVYVLSLIQHVSMLEKVLIHTFLLSLLYERGMVLESFAMAMVVLMLMVLMVVLPHGCPGVEDQECSY